MDMKASFDAVVVGAGAGGAAAAWRLCEQGLQVLLLDAGPRFQPLRDYPLNQPTWERALFPVLPNSQAQVSFAELALLDPHERELRSWNKVAGLTVRGERREVMGPGYAHVQGIGGSTLHFVGEAHRLHPAAMKLFSQTGAGCDWPINYADLEPYYTLCENLIGVAGPADQGARWRSSAYPQSAHPLSSAAQCLCEAGKKLGMHWQANSRSALSQPYDGRPACNYCGNCSRGCPRGDKGSADVTFIRRAEQSGRLTIKPNSSLVRLLPAKDGRIAALEYVENGQLVRQETPLLILAAGAVNTPRILLANSDREHPKGLANQSGQVGRNFMETLFWSSAGLLLGLKNSHMGLPSDAICWDFNAPGGIPGVSGGCRFNSNVQEIGLVGPIAYAARVVAGFGAQLKQGVREAFGSCISVGAIGESLPNAASFVDLDPQRKDHFGIPLPRIRSYLAEQDVLRLRFMAQQSRRLLAAAGVSEMVEEYGTWDNFSATHVFGTCRMGHAAETSVVRADGRAHQHDNLYITDASVFPSSGGGESPSLTIQALAVRAVDSALGRRLLPASVEPKS